MDRVRNGLFGMVIFFAMRLGVLCVAKFLGFTTQLTHVFHKFNILIQLSRIFILFDSTCLFLLC